MKPSPAVLSLLKLRFFVLLITVNFVCFLSADCLELLLDLGGDVNIARIDGFTPLHGAAAQGHDR